MKHKKLVIITIPVIFAIFLATSYATCGENPLALSTILDKCQISQVSGHDKLNFLVDNGLLVPVFDTENEITPKYQTPFSNVKMDIEKKSMVVKIQLQKISMQQSALLQVIQ
jgi:hypothetical protein